MSRPAHMRINAAGRQVAKRLLTLQLSVAAVAVIFFAVFTGWPGAFSALIGALITIVPNSVFSVLAFRSAGARSAHSVVNSFMAGEALKIMLSMVMLIVALSLLSEPLLPLFAVFALLHLLHLVAPILLFKTN